MTNIGVATPTVTITIAPRLDLSSVITNAQKSFDSHAFTLRIADTYSFNAGGTQNLQKYFDDHSVKATIANSYNFQSGGVSNLQRYYDDHAVKRPSPSRTTTPAGCRPPAAVLRRPRVKVTIANAYNYTSGGIANLQRYYDDHAVTLTFKTDTTNVQNVSNSVSQTINEAISTVTNSVKSVTENFKQTFGGMTFAPVINSYNTTNNSYAGGGGGTGGKGGTGGQGGSGGQTTVTGGTNNVSIPINIEAQATVYAQKFWTYFAQYAPPKSTFSSGPWLTLGTDIGPIHLGITFSLPQAIKALGDLWDGLKATVAGGAETLGGWFVDAWKAIKWPSVDVGGL